MNYISQWDGSSWSEMGSASGTNEQVYGLVWSSITNMLFAAGPFTQIGGVSANRIAGWNGNTWVPLGSGIGSNPSSEYGQSIATVDGVNLFVTGQFSIVGGTVSANNVAQWSGAQWLALGSGLNDRGRTIAIDESSPNGDVYVGGIFITSGDLTTNRVASFTCAQPSSPTFPTGLPPTPIPTPVPTPPPTPAPTPAPCWQGLGQETLGANADIYAMSKIGDLIYVGGAFTSVDGITANKIATYDTLNNEWSAIGNGIDGTTSVVLSIVSRSPTEIYVAGRFSSVGGLATSCLVKLDPTTPTWTSLYDSSTTGLTISVLNALVIANNKLYIGGTIAGTLNQVPTAKNIIAYDFTNGWEPVGLGFNNVVYALATDGFKIFAGGIFTTLGDGTTTMQYISQWDGSSWSAMGSASSAVSALTWSSTTNMLFAIGYFTTIGGVSANRVAGWNGNTWIDLGGGLDDTGFAISTDGVNVFVAGDFAAVAGGTIPANKIAQWNGAQWLTLGSGISNSGYSILLDGSKVYVGGLFTTSGDVPSNRIASFTCSQPSSPTFPTGLPPTPLPTPAPCWQGLGQETLGTNANKLDRRIPIQLVPNHL